MNIFMRAAKKKLRFNTDRGTLSAECLWDIHLEELNALTVELKDVASKSDDSGYLEALTAKASDSDDKLRFQVAEATILARVEEVKAREQSAENKQKRERLLAIIASKEAQELEGTDIDALRAMAEDLQ